jgi:hypothetical protein
MELWQTQRTTSLLILTPKSALSMNVSERHSFSARPVRLLPLAVVAAALLLSPLLSASAQDFVLTRSAPLLLAAVAVPSSSGLPDAPEAVPTSHVVASSLASDTLHPAGKMAGRYTKYIEPGESVPRLTARDKVVLGLKDAVSLFSITAWVSSAAWEQVLDNSPNYGQTGEGFAKRVGASALRDFTEGTFGDSVLAPLLHEDPRYYRMGKGHNFVKRVVYAGTRGLITRTDGGHTTPNFANTGGNFAGALLTGAYYPARNTTFSETMQTFGSSVGGSAFGFAVTEFLPDVFHALHLPAPGY